MFIQDYLSANRWEWVHPMNKVMFPALFVIFAFLSQKTLFLCAEGIAIILFIISSVLLPWRTLLKMLIMPFGFVLLGSLPLIITDAPTQIMHLWNGYGISYDGLQKALLVMSRSFALTAAMYWFVLVTQVQELVYIFRKMRLPGLFIDIVLLVYRNIFLLLEVSTQIKQTQICRMGYGSIRSSYRSLITLMGQTFVISYYRADRQYNSIVTRGYQGEWPVSVLSVDFSVKYLIVWFVWLAGLILGYYFYK